MHCCAIYCHMSQVFFWLIVMPKLFANFCAYEWVSLSHWTHKTGKSLLTTVRRVAPSWCLLSSALPVWEQNAKVTYPPWHFSGQSSSCINLHITLVFNIKFLTQPLLVSFIHLRQFPIHFLPFLDISAILSQFEAFIALIQPFTTISIHFDLLPVVPWQISNNLKIQNFFNFTVYYDP